MNWTQLKSIPKFTPIEQLDFPKTKLRGLYSYDLGGGFLIGFSHRIFEVVDLERVESGEPSEYALSIYFFLHADERDLHFHPLEPMTPYSLPAEEHRFEVLPDVRIGDSFREVRKKLQARGNYANREVRSLIMEYFLK
ncbi:hypothetical protein QWJ34_26355 [Saccharibacillus sp. CPCC 101409]|uniref:hypothetical protein n=1 Tax=Saccharibacillus sp. CPCC 101409 TaxID=3058041 RepID=UPI002673037D|nr:hypothetical protein [Saccharibacillus sp. CPCC 101409]MDO3413302.1 hypothetical protein [Saccharibacillus sp. CPCC 101409]